MTTETEEETGDDTAADVGHDLDAPRVTAPMSEYSFRSVVIGFFVLVVGVAVTFGVPLLAVGL
ncbi:DUF7550 family protein [Natrarchaeobaculum aegyptiacum]|uniref:Uncharacterized protein n=1 Tax=Natrarchaeobaculum aegyptiacum TaxID=745377 RepID=A0A2Z2I1B1_9EURY|nr:hypothetical protein [Natrarchaeobaculum aegyptiacum]ARS91544.1 hypothetical protein B1756_18665 [Natrarchaeobaculum aegyptiacum]